MEPHETGFDDLVALFPDLPYIRNFVIVDVDCIRDSCGYGVPIYEFKSERESLKNWCDNKSKDEMLEYRAENNSRSLDGLPGLDIDRKGT